MDRAAPNCASLQHLTKTIAQSHACVHPVISYRAAPNCARLEHLTKTLPQSQACVHPVTSSQVLIHKNCQLIMKKRMEGDMRIGILTHWLIVILRQCQPYIYCLILQK